MSINEPAATPPAPDPTASALLGLLRDGLKITGGLLAAHGVVGPNDTITPDNWEFIVGVVMALAPVAYGWWLKIKAAKDAKVREAVAVQAGLNIATAGAAIILKDSATGVSFPKPVTVTSAQKIIADFGPTVAPVVPKIGQPTPPGVDAAAVTDALNASQLKGKMP